MRPHFLRGWQRPIDQPMELDNELPPSTEPDPEDMRYVKGSLLSALTLFLSILVLAAVLLPEHGDVLW